MRLRNIDDNCTKCGYGKFNFSFSEDHIELICTRCNHLITITKDIDVFMIKQSLLNDKIKNFFSNLK